MNQTTKPKLAANRLTMLWQTHGPNSYPLDMNLLVEEVLNSGIFEDQLTVRLEPLKSIEGSLLRIKNRREWLLLLNKNTRNKKRQRFTFAHEIGHFICHRQLKDKFEENIDTINDFRDTVEKEANEFAAYLLMPANVVRSEFNLHQWNIETLIKISNRFECSLQASALRFVELTNKPVAFVVSRDGIIVWSCKSRNSPYMSAYKFGDPLPKGSHALERFENCISDQIPCEVGPVWCESPAVESQYFDKSGNGYQYTCIEFVLSKTDLYSDFSGLKYDNHVK